MADRELTSRCLELISRLDTIDRCPPNVVENINLKPKPSLGKRLIRRSGNDPSKNPDAPEFAELRSAFRLKKKIETFLSDAKKLFGLQEHSVLFPPFSHIFHFAWDHIIWELAPARGIDSDVIFQNHTLSYVFF